MITKKNAENAEKFICEKCDFICSKKSNYDKHILTRKHMNNDISLLKINDKIVKKYTCECGKEYNHRQGLYTHKKKCNYIIHSPVEDKPDIVDLLINENKEFKNVIIELFKSNNDLQHKMIEICKNTSNTTINSHNNSNNKTFNLQFFLNEQCKDAMNLMDFVNTFQLKISDMERIGELGYVEGISNIIIEKLNEMDIYKRPIHCSDAKREIMHIKDNNVWSKDTANNDKMRKAIKHITWLNTNLLFAWAADHPGVVYSDHKLNDKYCEMVVEAMGGKRNKTMEEGEAKIIKKISKTVLIDKHSGV